MCSNENQFDYESSINSCKESIKQLILSSEDKIFKSHMLVKLNLKATDSVDKMDQKLTNLFLKLNKNNTRGVQTNELDGLDGLLSGSNKAEDTFGLLDVEPVMTNRKNNELIKNKETNVNDFHFSELNVESFKNSDTFQSNDFDYDLSIF